MNQLEQIYQEKCNLPSDINEHLPTLKKYTEECDHVTEMGVRWVVSTYAFMMGKPKKLVSYDIEPVEAWGTGREFLVNLAKDNGVHFEFHVADTLKIEIEKTDLLFLDTDHTYEQVSGELKLHADKSNKYIVFHDTTSFEFGGFDGDKTGIWAAIKEFLEANPHWTIHERFTNNNGLTILKRNNNGKV